MKKTFLTAILAIVCTLCLCFGLAACGGVGTEQGGTEQGGTEQGGTEQGGTEQGGTEQGGTEQGGTEQPKEYTVTFDANGGAFSDGTALNVYITVKENAKLTAPLSPTRDNYTFAGWTKTKDGSDLWQFGEDAVTSNVTLWAKWTQESAVLFSVDGASIEGTEVFLYVEAGTEEVNLTGGKVVCSADSTWHLYRKGSESEIYTKTASALADGNNEFRIVVASKDGENVNTYNFTVHRKYIVDITYMTNDTMFDTKQVMTGSPLTEEEYNIECMVKGYTFNGWEHDLEYGEIILAPLTFTADLTAIKYKFIYDANGGTTSLQEAEYDMDSTITIDSGESFTRNNYTILSFNTQPNGLGEQIELGSEFKFDFAEDTTIYAIWDCDFILDTMGGSSGLRISGVKRQKEVVSLDGEYDYISKIDKEPIKRIGPDAFKNDTVLKEIRITENIEEIPKGAFSGCSNLASITIAYHSVTDHPLGYIFGESKFDGSVQVEQFEQPSSTRYFYYYVPRCLKNVSFEGSTEIPRHALWCIESIKVISIPASVTSIGKGAFSGTSGIEEVHITDFAAWYNIDREGSVFSGGKYRLYLDNSELTELQIPADSKEIPANLFEGWAGLKNVTIPDSVTAIGEYAFWDCSGLESVTIGEGVTSIGAGAFSGCSRLTCIEIPDNVTEIGTSAFNECSELSNVTIGKGVTSIGDSAFWLCVNLENVTWNAVNCTEVGRSKHIFDAYNKNSSKTRTLTLGEGVQTIPAYTFYDGRFKGDLRIPASVKSIGESAFGYVPSFTGIYITDLVAWCKIEFADSMANPLSEAGHLYLNDIELETLKVPAEITEIKAHRFSGCISLKKVIIPAGVTSIGERAFYGCSNLECITVEAENLNYSSQDGIVYNKQKTEIISVPKGIKGAVTIPDGVASIGEREFYDCIGMTSIEIPNSVTSIGEYAFSGCRGLESVTIGEGVTSIGAGAFSGCPSLKTVYYKGTPSEWTRIQIGSNNNNIFYATRYYYSDEKPTAEQWQESKNWWHYDGDGSTIVLWTKEEA